MTLIIQAQFKVDHSGATERGPFRLEMKRSEKPIIFPDGVVASRSRPGPFSTRLVICTVSVLRNRQTLRVPVMLP